MNNDDMSDEEFDAFLRGEDDLSRRLQGLTQPAPGPRLDAAILGYVKAGLEQEAQAAQVVRPAAANDPAIEGAPPRLAPGLGRRWRIPAGIAAGVLAGVLGHQVYQGSGTRMEERMAAAPVAEASPQVANVTVDMAAPAPAAPPAIVAEAPMAPSAPVVMAEAPPPVAEAKMAAAAPATALAEPRPRPEPEPPPVRVAAAPPAQLQRVEITGSSIKRTSADTASPVQVLPRESIAAAAKPSKPSYEGYNSDNPVPEMPMPSARVAAAPPAPVPEVPSGFPAPAPAPAPAAPPPMMAAVPARGERYDVFNSLDTGSPAVARSARPAARSSAKESVAKDNVLELSKMAAPPAHDKRADDWLEVIDAMLKAKLDKDALAEWAKFRAVYPDYPVPAATRKRIDAIKQ